MRQENNHDMWYRDEQILFAIVLLLDVDALRFELGKVEVPAIRERMVGLLSQVDKTLAGILVRGFGARCTSALSTAGTWRGSMTINFGGLEPCTPGVSPIVAAD